MKISIKAKINDETHILTMRMRFRKDFRKQILNFTMTELLFKKEIVSGGLREKLLVEESFIQKFIIII